MTYFGSFLRVQPHIQTQFQPRHLPAPLVCNLMPLAIAFLTLCRELKSHFSYARTGGSAPLSSTDRPSYRGSLTSVASQPQTSIRFAANALAAFIPQFTASRALCFRNRRPTDQQTMAESAPQTSVASCDVPVVSYEDLLNKTDLSAVIEEAFGYDGMGILAVSGVPGLNPKRETLLPLAFQFANMPDAVKDKCTLEKAYYSFGWSHGKENLQGKPDYSKGSYYNNPETNDPTNGDEELIERFPSFFHPNIWPKEELPALENAFMELGQLIVDTGILVAHQCDKFVESKSPEYDQGKLHRIISTVKCSKARLLHYYALSEEAIAKQKEAETLEDSFSWCGWHNDHGALTGLVQAIFTDMEGKVVPNPDPAAGLYVKNRKGQIIKANIPSGHLIFQIGETAQILSGGILQATPHAVRGPQVTGVNRETLAVFMQPRPHERMAIPSGDPHVAGKTENLPKGVPPLLSRWNNDMNYDEFTQATFKAYY